MMASLKDLLPPRQRLGAALLYLLDHNQELLQRTLLAADIMVAGLPHGRRTIVTGEDLDRVVNHGEIDKGVRELLERQLRPYLKQKGYDNLEALMACMGRNGPVASSSVH